MDNGSDPTLLALALWTLRLPWHPGPTGCCPGKRARFDPDSVQNQVSVAPLSALRPVGGPWYAELVRSSPPTGALVRTNLGLRWCTCDPRQRYRHQLSARRASRWYRFRTSVPSGAPGDPREAPGLREVGHKAIAKPEPQGLPTRLLGCWNVHRDGVVACARKGPACIRDRVPARRAREGVCPHIWGIGRAVRGLSQTPVARQAIRATLLALGG